MGVIICYATCWACKFGDCYDPPKEHSWGDVDDFEWAAAKGYPEPGICNCPCAHPEGDE